MSALEYLWIEMAQILKSWRLVYEQNMFGQEPQAGTATCSGTQVLHVWKCCCCRLQSAVSLLQEYVYSLTGDTWFMHTQCVRSRSVHWEKQTLACHTQIVLHFEALILHVDITRYSLCPSPSEATLAHKFIQQVDRSRPKLSQDSLRKVSRVVANCM